MAEELAEALGLDEVRFVPAANPPHRPLPACELDQRTSMVRLAIAENPRFTMDLREGERPGPSYMVDTLSSLRRELGEEPALFLLLGADAFLGLPTWHRWESLFEYAHIAVAHRPGHSVDASHAMFSQSLRNEWRHRYCDLKPSTANGAIVSIKITELDISSSAIRKALSTGNSARYLLPDPVLHYIHSNHLYSSGTP